MSKSLDIEIIKNDLLKVISKSYTIDYNDLLVLLDNIKEYKTTTSKYSCDHSFFSRDNEESFYWAGFIAADGCVFKKSSNSKQLIISLSKKDIDHLKLFKEHIKFNGPILSSVTKHSLTNTKWNDSIKNTISISSVQLFEDLKRFNIEPNKTKIYTFPQWLINHKLVNHFMRGYVDGDGSFYEDKVRNRICFELRGNKDFLIDYKNILESNLKFKSKVNVTTPDSTSKIKYSGKTNVPEIVNFLYKNGTIYLDRKFKIIKGIKCKDL